MYRGPILVTHVTKYVIVMLCSKLESVNGISGHYIFYPLSSLQICSQIRKSYVALRTDLRIKSDVIVLDQYRRVPFFLNSQQTATLRRLRFPNSILRVGKIDKTSAFFFQSPDRNIPRYILHHFLPV